MSNIALEAIKLSTSAPVELYVLDLTPLGGPVQRYCPQTNELGGAVVWQGNAYTPFPLRASGFKQSQSGPFARPRLSCSNVLGSLGPLIRQYNNLRGARLIRKRTYARFLDAVNFERINWLRASEAVAGSIWSVGDVTLTANALLSPTGTTTAELMVEGTGTIEHHVTQVAQCTLAAGDKVTASIHAKAGPGPARHLDLRFTQAGAFATGGFTATVDLSTGELVTAADGLVLTIEAAAEGYTRFAITASANSAGSPTFRVRLRDPSSSVPGYAGNGSSGVCLWGAQLNLGDSLRPYQAVGSNWSGNPNADPLAEWRDEVWKIDRCLGRNRLTVDWELCNPIDLPTVMLPGRTIDPNYCPWFYRSSDCGYTGGAVAKVDDSPTSNPADDRCSKRQSGCKKRFGDNGLLPGGFFPGVGITRQA